MSDLSREVTAQVAVLRDEIEELLLRAETQDSEALREAGTALSRYLGRAATDDALLSDLDEARAALARARASILRGDGFGDRDADDGGDGESLDEADGIIAAVRSRTLDHLSRSAGREGAVAARAFVASAGAPTLYEAPEMPAPEMIELQRPWDEDPDLEEEPPRERKTDPPRDAPMRAELELLGRQALEDIAILGGLRRLHDHEPWIDARPFEARLLSNLDAVWALDRPKHPEVPPLVVPVAAFRYTTEWSVPDWGRSFALALTLGCARGPVALRWILLAMRRAPREVLSGFADGLSLGSSDEIDRAVVDLLQDSPVDVTLAALEIARRRRNFPAGVMVPLFAHPDERVLVAAIACTRHAKRALAVELLDAFRDSTSSAVGLAALRELSAHGDARARNALRQILHDASAGRRAESDGQEALRLLALGGDPTDAERVLAGAFALPECAHWLGYFGERAHLDRIAAELGRAREQGPAGHDRARRLERAIARLSGVDPSRDLAVVLKDAKAAVDAAPANRRLRAGRPHTKELLLAELNHPKTLQGERRQLVLELALCFPDLPRLEIEGWVARQRADLAGLTG